MKIEYLYEDKDTLKIIMDLKLGFFKTLHFFFIAIIFIPIGLFITLPILYLILTFHTFPINLSLKDAVLGFLVIAFPDYIATMALYQWLKYNFGQEIITLNNKDQILKYEKLIFLWKKERIFEYSNIIKVFIQSSSSRSIAYTEYYCALKYNGKEPKIGQTATFNEAEDLVKTIKQFMKNKHNKHKKK